MGVVQDHALGRLRTFFATPEGTPKTFAQPVATSAVKVLTSQINYEQERKNRDDSRQTRSLVERITGRKKISWNCEAYLIPSGTATTPPDIRDLLIKAMGTEAIGGSDVTYSLSDSQSLGMLSIAHQSANVISQAASGCVVNTMTIKVSGSEDPKISFDGFGCAVILTGTTTLNGALSGGETAVPITAATANAIEVGSLIKIGTSDNSGLGHLVTVAGATLTVSPAVVGAQSNGAAVVPFFPTETVSGSPIGLIDGSITLVDPVAGTIDLPITSFELTLNNNAKMVEDEAFSSAPTDVIYGYREVTGTIGVRARKDQIIRLNRAKNRDFSVDDLAVRFGPATAGRRFTIDIDRLETGFSPFELPQADEATFQLPYVALATSAGANEFTFKHH